MKSFNARRRFRSAIHAVQLVRFLGHFKAAIDGEHGDVDGHGHEHATAHPNGTAGKTNSHNNSNSTPEGIYQSTILTKVVQTSAGKLPAEVVDHLTN